MKRQLFIGYKLVGLRRGHEVFKPKFRQSRDMSRNDAIAAFRRLVKRWDRVAWWTYEARGRRWVEQYSFGTPAVKGF